MSRLLPEEFSALERFAHEWSLATENERAAKRRRSSPQEIREFYEAMLLQLAVIIEHLNRFSLDSMPEPERRLLYLTLSLGEIAPNVELYEDQPLVPFSFDEGRFKAVHGDRNR